MILTAVLAAFAQAATKKTQPVEAVKPMPAAVQIVEPAPAEPVAPQPVEKPKAAAPAAAPAAVREEVISRFISWDKKLKTLKTDFEQETSFEGVPISQSEGRIYKVDNLIRLDSLENGKVMQSAITDKSVIKIVDAKGKFITALSWQEWQASQPNQALFDFGNYSALLKTHTVKEFAVLPNGYKLVLQQNIKNPQEGYELDFILDKEAFPSELSITSQGVKTRTVLKDISKNTVIEEGVFK